MAKQPWEGRRFRELIKSLDDYVNTIGTAKIAAAQMEIERRSDFCDRLLDEIAAASAPVYGGAGHEYMINALPDLLCKLETLYYHAFRLQAVYAKALAIKKIRARGVTITRNILIEHSDQGPAGILYDAGGPNMSGVALEGQPLVPGSNGVFADADELIRKLENYLREKLHRPQSAVTGSECLGR